jgi:type I restriction enzyme, S subunit
VNLPKGWVKSKLKNLISSNGLLADGDWIESKDQDPNGKVRLIQLADIGDGLFKDKSSRYINEDNFEKLNCQEILEGDILIARLPDPLGRACIFPKITNKCITSVDICILRPGTKNIDLHWLLHFINSPQTREYIEDNSSGTTRKRITRKKLDIFEIPVPPLNEQKRIVKKIDELLSIVECITNRLDNALIIINQFRQSILSSAISGKLTERWREKNTISEDWINVYIKDVTTKVGSGSTPKGGKSAYKERGIPLVRSMNIHFKGIKYKNLAFIDDEQAKKLSNVIIEEQDVLLNITGASIGRVTLAPINLVGARVNQHVSIIRTKADELLPQYLNLYLASPITQKWIQEENYGGTREALTKTMILDYEVSKPSVDEQKEIVSQVELLFTLADNIESKIEASKIRVDKLTQSILSKAFKGELVMQDPKDEPADKLLERIKAEQKKANPKRKSDTQVEKVDNSSKNLLSILEKEDEAISARKLLSLSAYKNEVDNIGEFFVQLQQLKVEKKIKVERRDNEDWISFCIEGNI